MENLYEILKNTRRGLKLYSPIIGDVELTLVCEQDGRRIIEVSGYDKQLTLQLDEFGRFLGTEAECILFPSKEYKSWKDWQPVLATKFTEGVLFTNHTGNLIWVCGDEVTSINIDTESMIPNMPLYCVNWNGLGFASPGESMIFHRVLDSRGFVCEHGQIKTKAITSVRFEDGDILYDETSNAILIFSRVSAGNIMGHACYFPDNDLLYYQDLVLYGSINGCKLRMATPKEVKLLLQKLVENNTGWDAKNKELISLKNVDFTTWLHYQPSYGICPPPMSQEQFEYFLGKYLLGEPYITSISLSDAQYRTSLLDAILTKYSKKYRKERK